MSRSKYEDLTGSALQSLKNERVAMLESCNIFCSCQVKEVVKLREGGCGKHNSTPDGEADNTVAFLCLLGWCNNPEFRSIRASLFFGMGMSGIAPILHKLILFWHQPEALHTTGYEVLMGLFYGVRALVYVTRIPER
ncbi:hypothetical protein PVK06_032847 [Gossypium arboreum]|uniref:Uncharacterized protein n=1 Tax=Gossypium arboreum TaxID=29729 RepID=A0ABR0NV00_GOSAR|nr:hypothetical protein PVK06_032847 [Gossypium arboreum]